MPLLSKNTLNQKKALQSKLLLFLVRVLILLVPEMIFQIFDGVKLIFDIQRHSINYSESNFKFQIPICILKKLGNSDKLQATSFTLQIFRLSGTCGGDLNFPNKTSADVYCISQNFLGICSIFKLNKSLWLSYIIFFLVKLCY